MKLLSLGMAALAALLLPVKNAHAVWTETVLHQFTGPDGISPMASLVLDAAGNLYGTTVSGGTGYCRGGSGIGCGTVFRLTPPAAGKTTWKETVLYSFTDTNGDGGFPEAGLVFDAAGNLYGATVGGGTGPCTGGCGTVFRLVPPAAGKTAWTETVLHAFSGADGAGPSGQIVLDASGNLYGTTPSGGALGGGVVFRLSPPAPGKTGWIETILCRFTSSDGGLSGSVVLDSAGNLYSVTARGGKYNAGTVFRLAPPAAGSTAWVKTVLLDFNGTDGGNQPATGLTIDKAGNLYGTFSSGTTSASRSGGVFQLAPPAAGRTAWTETVLFDFNSVDGEQPDAALALDALGNLYGTSYAGGSTGTGACFNSSFTCGTVFKLSH